MPKNGCRVAPDKQRTLCIRGPDAIPPEPRLQHLVLGLKELDDDELSAMDPARPNHQQEREKWRRRTHDASLLQTSFESSWTRRDKPESAWHRNSGSRRYCTQRSTKKGPGMEDTGRSVRGSAIVLPPVPPPATPSASLTQSAALPRNLPGSLPDKISGGL